MYLIKILQNVIHRKTAISKSTAFVKLCTENIYRTGNNISIF